MSIAFKTRRIYTRPGRTQTSSEFVCRNCGTFVSAHIALSGVGNRNHCPYCLASRHLDQFEAGDRLSACKACMQPVGLTFKRTAKKYTGHQPGELMIVHCCEDCGDVSINRIAADDDTQLLLAVLEQSGTLAADISDSLVQQDITLLTMDHLDQVQRCLFGTEVYGAYHN
jgi:predicted RNA-binding Zn-ribbon protein involved in translation (DUF1610 family)